MRRRLRGGRRDDDGDGFFSGEWRAAQVEAVRVLCARGADETEEDVEGFTALHWAAAMGEPACIRALVQIGANVEARDRHDTTPLHSAAGKGQVRPRRPIHIRSMDVHDSHRIDALPSVYERIDASSRTTHRFAACMCSSRVDRCMIPVYDTSMQHLVRRMRRGRPTHRRAAGGGGQVAAIQSLLESGADLYAPAERGRCARPPCTGATSPCARSSRPGST
jgi:hypothetical protein